ncbi:DUF92 domain-containing protein, partial [Bacillus licheniformis]|uniref:DUF92 domain-containing protein n=1 Tax=Bacillus licheniformis TaxID=1402 RepID=UPI000F5D9D49
GGVSRAGLGAGLLGSALLSLFAFPTFGWKGVLFAIVFGFVSSLLDSVLGAAFQRKYRAADGGLQDRPNSPGDLPIQGSRFITNNTVNLMSLTLTPLLGWVVVSIM